MTLAVLLSSLKSYALRLQGTSLTSLAQRTEVINPPGSPRRARAPARATALSGRLSSPRSWPLPPSALRPTRPLLFRWVLLHRCRGCRRNAPRRLLDHLQPQLPRLPPQRLDLLLLHLGVVLLLAPAHVRHPVLQRL